MHGVWYFVSDLLSKHCSNEMKQVVHNVVIHAKLVMSCVIYSKAAIWNINEILEMRFSMFTAL